MHLVSLFELILKDSCNITLYLNLMSQINKYIHICKTVDKHDCYQCWKRGNLCSYFDKKLCAMVHNNSGDNFTSFTVLGSKYFSFISTNNIIDVSGGKFDLNADLDTHRVFHVT